MSGSSQHSHLHSIRDDRSYADVLAGWDPTFYRKYADTLTPPHPGDRVLDVGCGVGQVVAELRRRGAEAYGVDVAQANIDRARDLTPGCQWYDGGRLPFPDGHFERVGALNVLEHVEDPEGFLAEMVRVTRPGGHVVVSSPNFLRVLGWRDYHPRMRGVRQKVRNGVGLLSRWTRIRHTPETVRFERMIPIVKEPFTPDDDAIVCTNALEISFFLRSLGCEVTTVACTDRQVTPILDFLLNLIPLKYGLFNAFVVARRPAWDPV
jgi:SAM-dependent methyltransferase